MKTTHALEIAVNPHEGRHVLRYRGIHPVVKDLEPLLCAHRLRTITSLNPWFTLPFVPRCIEKAPDGIAAEMYPCMGKSLTRT
jgi:hypothetical protein